MLPRNYLPILILRWIPSFFFLIIWIIIHSILNRSLDMVCSPKAGSLRVSRIWEQVEAGRKQRVKGHRELVSEK